MWGKVLWGKVWCGAGKLSAGARYTGTSPLGSTADAELPCIAPVTYLQPHSSISTNPSSTVHTFHLHTTSAPTWEALAHWYAWGTTTRRLLWPCVSARKASVAPYTTGLPAQEEGRREALELVPRLELVGAGRCHQ